MSELFDNLSRILATPNSRRQTLQLIGGALAGATLGLLQKRVVAQLACQSFEWKCAPFYCCSKALNYCINALGVPTQSCTPPQICCDGACLPKARLCPKVKTQVEKHASKFGDLVILFGGAAAVILALPSPAARAAGIVFSASASLSAYYAKRLADVAKDPPDPNFTEIVKPVTPSLAIQPITTVDGFTQQFADTVNALLENLEKSSGLGLAIFVSLNRADGARDAGDAFWELQQLEAAQKYILQLGELTDAQPQLFANFANAYTLGTLPRVQVTTANMLAFQEQLRNNGLSPEFTKMLTDLGADSATQNEILQNLMSVDLNEAKALEGEFPNQFTDPSFATSFKDAAQALKDVMIVGKINEVAVASKSIINNWTGTCLASLGDSKAIDNPVVVAACSGAANTLWDITSNGEIRNRWTETCLASLGDSKAIDNPVVVAACSGAANTLWDITSNGEIRNRWTETCLASLGDSKAIDNPVVVAACSGAANILWTIKN